MRRKRRLQLWFLVLPAQQSGHRTRFHFLCCKTHRDALPLRYCRIFLAARMVLSVGPEAVRATWFTAKQMPSLQTFARCCKLPTRYRSGGDVFLVPSVRLAVPGKHGAPAGLAFSKSYFLSSFCIASPTSSEIPWVTLLSSFAGSIILNLVAGGRNFFFARPREQRVIEIDRQEHRAAAPQPRLLRVHLPTFTSQKFGIFSEQPSGAET